MAKYVAKRVRFRNGERISVLQVVNGLPVHEVTLYLNKYRIKGRAANTIHGVCRALALLYRLLDKAGINLLSRLGEGKFLTFRELEGIASAVQYSMADLDDDDDALEDDTIPAKSNVISIARIGFRHQNVEEDEIEPVDVAYQAIRIRYIADFLRYISDYVGATLDDDAKQHRLASETKQRLAAFEAHIPQVSNRAKLGAREGLSVEEQNQLLEVIHPDSPQNPWGRKLTRMRNWLIIVLLLGGGMRQGELRGLQIGDLRPNQAKLLIIRRADAKNDLRIAQPVAKTSDREIELSPSIMRALWSYINNERHSIKAARSIPQVFVSDEGDAISESSINKIFRQVRAACPGLPDDLTSHVMRHTWNERFSEQADVMGLPDAVEEKARNNQQGWSENSKSAATYTRRHTARKGREMSLKLQETLDAKLGDKE